MPLNLPSMVKKSEKLDKQNDQWVKLFASKAAVSGLCGISSRNSCTLESPVTSFELQLVRLTGHHSACPNGSSPQLGSTRKLQHDPGLSDGRNGVE